MTSKVIYKGALRTEATHIRSGNTIITDAPTDNKGKGEAFSPTDLVATALASCMLTIMGIKASEMNINIEGALDRWLPWDPLPKNHWVVFVNNYRQTSCISSVDG